jgi:hypothetical protein
MAAFGTHPRVGIAALMLGISRVALRQYRVAVAAFILHCQLLRLGALLLMATTERPQFCITREAFDETTHKVVFQYVADLPEGAQVSHWHVFVFRLTLWIGWKDRSPVQLEIVLPPIIVLSTSASSLFDALTKHPQYTRVFNAVTLLRQASHHSIRCERISPVVHTCPIC